MTHRRPTYRRPEPPKQHGGLVYLPPSTPAPKPVPYNPENRRRSVTPNPKPEAPRPRSYTLPLIAPSGAFSHEQASELLEAVWSLEAPAIASISATASKLELSITCPTGSELAFQSTLYGVNPDLDITPRPASIERRRLPTLLSISGERHEDLEALPMKDVAQLGKHDPINRILEACYPLEEDEFAEIHFFLKPAFNERLDRAYRSGYQEGSFLWIFRWQELKFNPKVYDEVIERMRQYAFDVVSVIALSGRSEDRLAQRAHAISAAFSSRTTNTGSEIRHFARGILHDDWQRHGSFSLNDVKLDERYGTLMTVSELANLFHLPSDQVKLPALTRLKLAPVALSPQMLDAEGVQIGRHTFRGHTSAVRIPERDLVRGVNVILGKTGQGKTTLAHQLVADASRRNPDWSLVVLDPHGQWAEGHAAQSIIKEQLDRTYLIDFADVAFPIGLPLLAKPPGLSQDAYVSSTFELIKLLFANNWHPGQMERVIKNTVPVLCSMPSPTLMDFTRLFNDRFFRQKCLATVTDPAVLDFFRYYDSCSEPQQRQITNPVLNRIGALYETAPIRNITCRPDGLLLYELLDEGANLLFSFAGPEIEADADMLMEIIVAKIHQAMQSRSKIPEHLRRPTLLAIDESQRIKGNSLPQILSQDRKFGMIPVLLTQFLSNWAPRLEQAVIGNSASLITFALGDDDARKLAPMYAPFTAEQIINLDAHEPLVKISVNGKTSPAFTMQTERITRQPDPGHLRIARENARRRFGKPRAEVDRRFRVRPSPKPRWDDFDVSPLT